MDRNNFDRKAARKKAVRIDHTKTERKENLLK